MPIRPLAASQLARSCVARQFDGPEHLFALVSADDRVDQRDRSDPGVVNAADISQPWCVFGDDAVGERGLTPLAVSIVGDVHAGIVAC